MKHNYLIWSLCLSIISGIAFAQDANIVGNMKVKVEPNTLFYFGENLNLKQNVTDNKVIENEGNIKIDGNLTNAHSTGENFVSTWIDKDTYGQVIINQNKDAGKLAMEKGKINPAVFAWGQFAIPFAYNNAQEAMQNLFGVDYTSSTNRYNASMMVWNNNKPRWDHLNASSILKPGDYVILNLSADAGNVLDAMNNNDVLIYKGAPTNKEHSITGISSNFYQTIGAEWNDWKNKRNIYNEAYHTYIEDHRRDLSTDPVNYGKHSYQFGNPYTSNIDLSLFADSFAADSLIGVFKFGNLDWNIDSGSSSLTDAAKKATYNGTIWAGDAEALIAKPFEPFVLTYANEDIPASFTFDDTMKTFSMTSNASLTQPSPLVPGQSNYQTEGVNNADFYQLRLNLYDENDAFTGNRIFVVVTNGIENGTPNNLESEYSDFGNRNGFYLAQENAEGLPVNSSARKMDINTVNLDFENKPIPLFFNREAGDPNGYYLKANLFYGSIFNQLEEENYPDQNSFYFYDQTEDVFIPITTDFNYYIGPDDIYGEKIRYELYWNANPDDRLGLGEELAGHTIVYKDQLVHKVRFNQNWNTAEVKVFDLSGRNILTYNNVDTKTDLTIKLDLSGVYFVRIKADTGEVYTQKILK